jgi:hypothetical protein
MKTQAYDLIGDIHGQHGKLKKLLEALGYERQGLEISAPWRHPGGRKVLFLGDYIDRGPAIRETLHTVRAMVDAGQALAIMGNHEYNAICAATPDGQGGFLRSEKRNRGGQRETLRQFIGFEDEWELWKLWMKRLPMFLDLGDLRAVHACWDARAIDQLSGKTIEDPAFLVRTASPLMEEFRAVETLLKGPELKLPEGSVFYDKEGIARKNVRVRWWGLSRSHRIGEIIMPEPTEAEVEVPEQALAELPNYPLDHPPVFFGHYWFPPHRQRMPLAANIACLDYSAAFADNALTAYRWQGEQVLRDDHFFTV